MKSGSEAIEPDAIDLQIIAILQEHGRIPLVKLGEHVGLVGALGDRAGQETRRRRASSLAITPRWMRGCWART